MRKYLLLFVLISGVAFSQSVNDYQYAIVPAKFDFLKKEDQFRLNTLTKLILQKYGFKVFMNNEEIPVDVENQRCNFLYANVVENNGILLSKVKIVLKDCRDKVLFETEYGSSREKEYDVAYNEALRAAAKSFDNLNYKYNGKSDAPQVPAVPIKEVAPKTDLIYGEPVPVANTTQLSNTLTTENTEVFYFAQPTTNGFQVVDTTPKVVMRLFNTSQKNVFIGTKANLNGVVIAKNGGWAFEYYQNGKLVSEALPLKF